MSKSFSANKIREFHNKIKDDKNNRFNSWNYCYKEFKNVNDNTDSLALNLAFYLASWGMYRGSSGLLQKDYKVHIKGVKIIKNHYYLRCNEESEISKKDIPNIMTLVEKLKEHYGNLYYLKNNDETKKITPTDTLISKILLGTLGCSPAFDRYFIDGVKSQNLYFDKLSKKSFESLFIYLDKNYSEIETFQNDMLKSENIYYPKLKIIDLYFWQEGFEKNNNNQK